MARTFWPGFTAACNSIRCLPSGGLPSDGLAGRTRWPLRYTSVRASLSTSTKHRSISGRSMVRRKKQSPGCWVLGARGSAQRSQGSGRLGSCAMTGLAMIFSSGFATGVVLGIARSAARPIGKGIQDGLRGSWQIPGALSCVQVIARVSSPITFNVALRFDSSMESFPSMALGLLKKELAG